MDRILTKLRHAGPLTPPPGIASAFSSDAPIRYIELEQGGAWAAEAIRTGTIPLGYARVPHDLADAGDRDAIVAYLVGIARSSDKAASFAREILSF